MDAQGYRHWVHDDEVKRVYDSTKRVALWDDVVALCGYTAPYIPGNFPGALTCPICDEKLRKAA